MRRKWKWVLSLCVLTLLNIFGCSKMDAPNSTTPKQGFHWNREESSFVDYTISGNAVEFRYAFCFENNSEDNVILSCITAKFRKSELRGWLKYETCYSGTLENEDSSVTIKAGEKRTIICVFSGEYLGGTVPEILSDPDISMILDHK